MAKKKLSYKEKISLLTEYISGAPYKKGKRVIKDTVVYRASVDIEEGEPWTPKHWKLTKYDEYVGKAEDDFMEFKDIKVIPSAWYEWSPKDNAHKELFKTYPYRAFLSCKGVTENMMPYVVFNSSEALSGKFANIAESVRKGVYIYSKDKPTDKIIVPLVKCLIET